MNVTVRDASGLVTGCTALPGYPDDVSMDDILAARPYVRDPGDGLRLDAMFFGTPCDENATVDVSGTGSALSVAIALTDVYSGCWTALAYHWVSIEFSEPVRADAVVASLHSVSAPTGSLAPDDRQAGPAVWQLAPGERPTANSRSFDVVVFEEECAGGESPEGRVVGPTVEYRSDAVVVSFGVTRLPGAGDCPTAPGAPFTVQLSEPVGERILIDAGGSRPVERVAFDDGLLVHTWRFPDELAAGRLAGFLGPDACTQTVHHDREVGQQHFEEWAGQVEGDAGYALGGTAWLGDWRAAARAFEAFEVYATPDGRERWIIAVASGQEWLGGGEDGALAAEFPYGALVVADLYRADVSGARTLWLPAFTGHTSGTPNCTSGAGNWPDPAPGPGAHTEAVAGDFRLGISSGRVTYEAGEPIDVEADLTYSGSAEAVTVHAGGGLLQFGFEQLDGDLEMSPAAAALGKDFELARGRAFVRQYSKSGGWSNDDPNADFYAGFIADPQFRLPRGIWRVYVWAQFFVGPDDQEVTLTSSIVITTR